MGVGMRGLWETHLLPFCLVSGYRPWQSSQSLLSSTLTSGVWLPHIRKGLRGRRNHRRLPYITYRHRLSKDRERPRAIISPALGAYAKRMFFTKTYLVFCEVQYSINQAPNGTEDREITKTQSLVS